MYSDALTRFTTRVSHYVRFRPGYPAGVADLFSLAEAAQVVDMGSGTGLLSRVFLEAGHYVTGVEPNREMREAGDRLLTDFARFRSVNARAEASTLPDACCDLVVAGQAFHWFDVDAARDEWRRILKPGGHAALIWNDRSTATPFMREVEELISVFAQERDGDGAIRERGRGRVARFFSGSELRTAEFTHSQLFDFEGLRGRLLSASYLPHENEAGELTETLHALFLKHQQQDLVSFDYQTMVYWGAL